jgi:hypothetical protein
VTFLLLAAAAMAGDPWKLTLDLKGNLSYVSEDWADKSAAGKLTWTLALDGSAEKQLGSKVNSKTVLKLAFGQTKESGGAAEKSTDLIDLESVLKLTLGGWVDPFVALRGVSSFADMSDAHTRYINPTTFSEGLGLMRSLVKKDKLVWDLRLGAAFKQKVDRWAPAYDWETQTTTDGGAEVVTEVNAKLLKDQVTLKSTLRAYEALFRDGSESLNDDWRYPDLNWQTSFSTTVAKYLMVGYTVELDYERENDANIQHRHLFSLGVTLSGPKPREKAAEAAPVVEPVAPVPAEAAAEPAAAEPTAPVEAAPAPEGDTDSPVEQ